MSATHSASPPVPDSSDDHLAKAKVNAQKTGDELKAAATTKAAEVLQTAQRTVQEAQQTVQDRSQEFWNEIQQLPAVADAGRFVREQPVKALLATFAAGIVVGLTMRR